MQLGVEEKYTIVCFDGYDNITGEEEFTISARTEIAMGQTGVSLVRDQLNGSRNIEPVLIPYKIIPASNEAI